MCKEAIYKNELKSVRVVQTKYYKEGEKIKFSLMARNKSNIIVKDKSINLDKDDKKLCFSKLPGVKEEQYQSCRMLISDRDFEIATFRKDM